MTESIKKIQDQIVQKPGTKPKDIYQDAKYAYHKGKKEMLGMGIGGTTDFDPENVKDEAFIAGLEKMKQGDYKSVIKKRWER